VRTRTHRDRKEFQIYAMRTERTKKGETANLDGVEVHKNKALLKEGRRKKSHNIHAEKSTIGSVKNFSKVRVLNRDGREKENAVH